MTKEEVERCRKIRRDMLTGYVLFQDVEWLRKKESDPVEYPTIRISHGKTPVEELRVCDSCRVASWYIRGYGEDSGGNIRYCPNCKVRMREATSEEKAEAIQFVRENGLESDSRQERQGLRT